MSELKECQLGEILDFIDGDRGKNYPSSDDYLSNGHCLFLNTGNVTTNGFVFEDMSFISKEKDAVLRKGKLERFDIILTTRGTVGNVAYYNNSVPYTHIRINSGMLIVRAIKNILPSYIYQLFRSAYMQSQFRKFASGSAQPQLPVKDLKLITVRIPDIITQKNVSTIITAYDDLIENNNRRIAILEEMAQKLYREWFVHFRFPGHENVKMVESEMGLIPEGWSVRKLGTVVNNLDSKRKPISTLKRKTMQGEYPYYGAAKVIDHVNSYIFDDKFLLMAEDGSVITSDNTPMLQYVRGKVWVNNHTHILQGNAVSTEYLFLMLSYFDIRGYITGAAQPKITQENMNRISILVPSTDVIKPFDNYAQKAFDQRIMLENKNANLRKTRDLLLPRLISGDIDVSDLDIPIKEG